MAYDFFGTGTSDSANTITIDGPTVDLPDASYVRDAALVRDGMDLILDGPNGTVTVEGYFAADDTPDLVAPQGYTLTPELVNSFAHSPAQYAQHDTLNDASPVGAVDEISGDATITHTDGSVEKITLGTSVYQGDVIETSTDGAVNISFIDETSFAVSEEARLAIDEYVFDPMTEAGTQNFSVLKGVFVFTSGLIGRDDPDDVSIATPSGSIGIRGTIIAGDVDSGEITVVEGAIVVRDLNGNEVTLDQRFETALLGTAGGVENVGLLSAQDVSGRFEHVSTVAPTLFSSINDAMAEEAAAQPPVNHPVDQQPVDMPDAQPGENFDANGSVDQNNDTKVDGTVDEGAAPVPADDGTQPVDGSTDGTIPGETTGDTGTLEPKPILQMGQMGTDPMGTNTGGMTTTQTTTQTTTTTTASTADAVDALNAPTLAPPPPLPETTTTLDQTQDPSTILPITGGAVNQAPLHILSHLGAPFNPGQVNIAPSNPATTNYFSVGSNQSFEYFFDLEFADPDSNAMHIQLSAASRSALTSAFGAQGTGWDFSGVNGHLTIYDTGAIGGNFNISLDVAAIDGQGASSGFYAYTLEAHATSTFTATASNAAMHGTTGPDTFNIGSASITASNNDIFFGDGNDQITLMRGTNNEIHLGTGDNLITVQNSSFTSNNHIYGGMGRDKFDIADFDGNKFFGLDGDDVIEIDSANTSLLSSATGVADLGHSSFKMGDELRAAGVTSYKHAPGDTGGYGDTLFITGTGAALDFNSSIPNTYFRGIERIDVKGSGVAAAITMNYQDVIEMTDYKNTLIFRADNNDNLTFTGPGFSGMTQVADDIALDDNYNGSGNGTFDVWTDGNVTILIEDAGTGSGPNVTGLP